MIIRNASSRATADSAELFCRPINVARAEYVASEMQRVIACATCETEIRTVCLHGAEYARRVDCDVIAAAFSSCNGEPTRSSCTRRQRIEVDVSAGVFVVSTERNSILIEREAISRQTVISEDAGRGVLREAVAVFSTLTKICCQRVADFKSRHRVVCSRKATIKSQSVLVAVARDSKGCSVGRL